MFEKWELWKELFYLWLTDHYSHYLASTLGTWEAVFSQMLDVPVRDGEVTDLLLPPAHQPPHRVERQDGALAGQQLQAGD